MSTFDPRDFPDPLYVPDDDVVTVIRRRLVERRIRADATRTGVTLGLAIGILLGILLALTAVKVVEASRPAPQPQAATSTGTPHPKAVPTPLPAAPFAAPVAVASPRIGPTSTPGPLAGVASWYRTPGLTSAAGPALRRALGPDWRGRTVTVRAGDREVTVRLTDWCQCFRGTATERLIDLSDDAFRELAPLSRGLVAVTVTW